MAKAKNVNVSFIKERGNAFSGIYFLGFIGAAVYYVQQALTFWDGVLGIIKALFWPAVLVYKMLGTF